MLKIIEREFGSVVVLDCIGRISSLEAAVYFRDEISDRLKKGRKKLLLNLADVSYINSIGIGELVSSYTTTTNYGGQLKLLALTKRVKDLLQITKLYTVFETFDDEAAAIRSFE